MSDMSISSIYLTGGSIDPSQLPQASAAAAFNNIANPDWRTFALTHLQNHGLRVINPLEFAWSDVDFLDAIEIAGSSDQRVQRALELIDQADGLLANLERPTYGTAMEMFYAHRRGKMVTVVGPSPFNPWVLSHSQARFNELDHALQYIIGQHPQADPVGWAIQYESLLAERYEQLPPAGEADYKFSGGDLPVLVVAPHATASWREGEFYEQEAFTGSMAALLNRMTGCHTLTSNNCLVADPCWYLETPFRNVFSDIVKAGKVGLVVMLMGSTWQEAPGVQISSYGECESVAEDFEKRLKSRLGALEAIGARSYDHYLRPFADYAATELKVPVVIIRLHKRYRMPRLQPVQFLKATELIAAFIAESGAELARTD
jgi:nucleoside 2-deoxyribosyltransferase